MKILVVIGTRPEAIKMAPVIQELRSNKVNEVLVCATGQHKEMLSQALRDFDIGVDVSLEVMRGNQSLASLTSVLLNKLNDLFLKESPDFVLVQGDTTTAMVAAMAAFYLQIKVGHVEAGLRSFDIYAPFPEEFNRRIISTIAEINFTPTTQASKNLLLEGVEEKKILQTGNPVVDALISIRKKNIVEGKRMLSASIYRAVEENKKIILLTCHRRENFGEPIKRIFSGIKKILDRNDNCVFVYPVHLNPLVRNVAHDCFQDLERVILLEPVGYRELVEILNLSYLVLTDSGGIQEEAPSFSKPVLVLRDVTERPEGVEAGVARLIGSEESVIVEEVCKLLSSKDEYEMMVKNESPYGDGQSSKLIAKYFNANH
jgi:UDP-N-acetylglucosamine 2-epimerase (non-hydrolysing)